MLLLYLLVVTRFEIFSSPPSQCLAHIITHSFYVHALPIFFLFTHTKSPRE